MSAQQQSCDINNCESFKRIIKILSNYNEWIYKENNKNKYGIIEKLVESVDGFSNKLIISDYNHIKEVNHISPTEFVSCHQSTSECISLSRHHRDNKQLPRDIYFSDDIKDVLVQKLLDQIHLFIYHPMIRKNNEENKGNYNDQQNRFVTIIDKNGDDNEEIDLYQEDEEENKYNDFNIEEEQKQEMTPNDIEDPERDCYNFGQQFFYWNYYKNHEWFITQKYQNLKDELLNNVLCRIGLYRWHLEYQNAVDKREEDERVQSLVSNAEFKYIYHIKENNEITMDHLLSILFYCNTDELQARLSSTYRRFPHELAEEFRNRHSHYYHFAKLLTETVNVYGNVMVDEDLAIYHGIGHPLFFEKMIAKFYCPTSTTTDRAIAAYFAG